MCSGTSALHRTCLQSVKVQSSCKIKPELKPFLPTLLQDCVTGTSRWGAATSHRTFWKAHSLIRTSVNECAEVGILQVHSLTTNSLGLRWAPSNRCSLLTSRLNLSSLWLLGKSFWNVGMDHPLALAAQKREAASDSMETWNRFPLFADTPPKVIEKCAHLRLSLFCYSQKPHKTPIMGT